MNGRGKTSCVVQPMLSGVRWVVADAEAITHVDYAAARVVTVLIKNLAEAGVELAIVRVPWDRRDDFDRHHLTEAIGPSRTFNRPHDAIFAFEHAAKPPGGKARETISDGRVQEPSGPQGEQ
jgi:sulfate permease, SulP family